jgi:2Fe-2S ferredoxin
MNGQVPIVFVAPDGLQHQVVAVVGDSVMATALANDVPGIVATCGGSAMCATCHVYVDEAHVDRLDAPGPEEDGLLGFTMAERLPTSRLSCQVIVTPALSGLEVRIPETQV